jgi:hypothetical protein
VFKFDSCLDPIEIEFEPALPVFIIGSQGRLICRAVDNPNVNRVSWYKNGVRLRSNKKYKIEKEILTIYRVASEDAGKYVCRLNVARSYATRGVFLKVIGGNINYLEEENDCEDKSSYTDCKLIVSETLCSKWGKYCCRSCREAGFDVISNENK